LTRISSSFTSIFSKAGERTQAPVRLEAIPAQGEETIMRVSKSSLLASAAFAGLMGGTMTRLVAAPAGGMSPQDNAQKSTGKASNKKSAVDKHSCAGKNSCKGKGGCSTSDNGCKGKNSCKGKGGCSTDGSKK